MRILVTGATGFLGKTLCPILESRGHDLVKLSSRNCDLTNQTSLVPFNNKRYDQIFHLAAWTQAGDFCLRHPGEQWVINQQINTNVLAWWHQYQPQAKMICMGTSCSYAPGQVLVEENYLKGVPIESLFTYAMTKRMLYTGLTALQKQFGLRYLHVVPSTLYGPGYHTDGRQMHFIFDLIRKILRGKLFAEPVILWGDGYQKRELVYVEDFVRTLLHLNDTYENDNINIGAGEERTIREFASLICEHVGFNFDKIEFDTSKYVGAKSKVLSIGKLNRLLPELSLTSLNAALGKTIDWFRAEMDPQPPKLA